MKCHHTPHFPYIHRTSHCQYSTVTLQAAAYLNTSAGVSNGGGGTLQEAMYATETASYADATATARYAERSETASYADIGSIYLIIMFQVPVA